MENMQEAIPIGMASLFLYFGFPFQIIGCRVVQQFAILTKTGAMAELVLDD